MPNDKSKGSTVVGARCPTCGRPSARGAIAPFCSKRHADLDLGKWLEGGYAIPGDPIGDSMDFDESDQ